MNFYLHVFPFILVCSLFLVSKCFDAELSLVTGGVTIGVGAVRLLGSTCDGVGSGGATGAADESTGEYIRNLEDELLGGLDFPLLLYMQSSPSTFMKHNGEDILF